MYPQVSGVRLETLLAFKWLEEGSIALRPLTHEVPMKNVEAHLFRELALCLVANYPELICRNMEANWLSITHKVEDPHHVFEVTDAAERQVRHQWGPESSVLSCTASTGNLQEVVAAFLAVPKKTISIAPHPWLNRMVPLWVGKRRWTQSRKMYKHLINAQRDRRAEKARKEIQDKLAQGFPAEAKALAKLDWKQIHKMEGVSP
jgi:hypothetical protein